MICVKNLVKTTKPPMVVILSLSKDQSSIYVLFDLWFIGVEVVSPSDAARHLPRQMEAFVGLGCPESTLSS